MQPNQKSMRHEVVGPTSVISTHDRGGEPLELLVVGDLASVREKLAAASVHSRWARFTTPAGELIHVRPQSEVRITDGRLSAALADAA